MKKLLFISFVCLLSSSVYAQKKEFGDGFYWELNEGVLTISGDGRSTNWHDRPWKSSKNEIRKVIIQNGVRAIGNWAFDECGNLSVVSIPQSVTSIGKYAFCGCPNLKSIVIPNSVVSMPHEAMYDAKLESIVIPYSLKHALPYSYRDANYICMPFLGGTNNSEYSIIIDNKKCGLKNSMGNWTIPLGTTYSNIEPFGDNYLRVWKNGKCGLITFDNKEIVPAEYGGLVLFGDNYLKVIQNGKCGLITFDNREIVPAELDSLEKCGKGFLRFKVNAFWGVMNYAGKIIIPTDRGYTKIGDYVSFTKRFPYEMDGYKGECNNLGVQVSKIKVATPKPTSTTTTNSSNSSNSSTSSSNTSSKSNNSNNKTTTVVVEHHRDPVPVQQWQACFACGGMGTMGCDNCGGGGTKYIGDRLHRCSRCNGRGIIPCNVCYGNKGKYITVYQ